MRPADFDYHEVVDGLNGTMSDVRDHLPEGMEEDDLIRTDWENIEMEIFRCSECGWWCETHEANDRDGEDICDDCHEEEYA